MADSSLLAAWSAAMMSWYICVKEGRRGKEKTENDHPYPGGPLHVGLQARSLQSAKRLPRLYLQNPKGCWHATVFEWNRGSQVKAGRTPGADGVTWVVRAFFLVGRFSLMVVMPSSEVTTRLLPSGCFLSAAGASGLGDSEEALRLDTKSTYFCWAASWWEMVISAHS